MEYSESLRKNGSTFKNFTHEFVYFETFSISVYIERKKDTNRQNLSQKKKLKTKQAKSLQNTIAKA